MNRLTRQALGAAAGLVADRFLGEPPIEPHPVAAFGQLMGSVEERLYRDDRGRGTVHAATGLGVGLLAGRLLGSTAAATYLSVAGRELGAAARRVDDALATGGLDAARAALPSLVGRDPSNLDESGIARAVVESVAENTVDAIVAPALWGAVAGAPGTLGYRAANTMDAMVGHHSDRYERYGWASARLDDLANWVPARVTAGLVVLARPGATLDVVRAVRRDAPGHPSPNAGVAEASFAAALGVQLGGTNRYGDRVEDRVRLGHGRAPARADIGRAIDLSADVTSVLVSVLLGAGLASLRPGE